MLSESAVRYINECQTPSRAPLAQWGPIRAELDRCWPWLLRSMQEYFQTHTKEQVFVRLIYGGAYLWPGSECAIVAQIIHHPIGIRDFRYWLQGGDLGELKTMHPGIEAWAKERGCKVVTGLGRDGWARAMDGDWHKGPATRFKWL